MFYRPMPENKGELKMSLFAKRSPKKQPPCRREMPTWEEIVDHMQGKGLSSFVADAIVRVLVSKDRTKRIVILRRNGYYLSAYQEIRAWDEDEWNAFSRDPDSLPGYWEGSAVSSFSGHSLYGTEEEAMREIAASPEYKMYFA